jgi:hypothetical protein
VRRTVRELEQGHAKSEPSTISGSQLIKRMDAGAPPGTGTETSASTLRHRSSHSSLTGSAQSMGVQYGSTRLTSGNLSEAAYSSKLRAAPGLTVKPKARSAQSL